MIDRTILVVRLGTLCRIDGSLLSRLRRHSLDAPLKVLQILLVNARQFDFGCELALLFIFTEEDAAQRGRLI